VQLAATAPLQGQGIPPGDPQRGRPRAGVDLAQAWPAFVWV